MFYFIKEKQPPHRETIFLDRGKGATRDLMIKTREPFQTPNFSKKAKTRKRLSILGSWDWNLDNDTFKGKGNTPAFFSMLHTWWIDYSPFLFKSHSDEKIGYQRSLIFSNKNIQVKCGTCFQTEIYLKKLLYLRSHWVQGSSWFSSWKIYHWSTGLLPLCTYIKNFDDNSGELHSISVV